MSSNFPPGFDKDFDNKVPPVVLKMLGIFVGIFVGLFLLTALVNWCQKKSDKDASSSATSGWNCTDQTSRIHRQPTGYAPRHPPYVPGEPPTLEPPTDNSPKLSAITFFRFGELVAATNGFSGANLLGEGGFGSVHRGMLADGRAVAVKQLKAGSVQGESEFRAEVEIISRVHHRHLVSLVGYCIHQHNRLLVYEFVPNSTLDFHLHGCGQPTMPLSRRLKLALGSAKGLAYLHEDCSPKIIHRDIKAANILLDSNFEAKVADFGLAKLTSETETHVTTRIMGTRGYLAPEYLITGKLTEKSDVYSYGVMLLELITGRQPIAPPVNADDDPRTLADWARPLLTEALQSNNYDSLIDPRLERSYDTDEMERLVVCAAACIRHSARKRPKMGQVVTVLDGGVSLDELNAGVMPGYSNAYSATRGSGNESKKYREDLKRFRQMVLESGEEQANSECTSDAHGASPLQSPAYSVEIRPLLT